MYSQGAVGDAHSGLVWPQLAVSVLECLERLRGTLKSCQWCLVAIFQVSSVLVLHAVQEMFS
jgi:hypothetical protein